MEIISELINQYGGVAGIISLIGTAGYAWWKSRKDEKYKLKLDKELESFKSEMSKELELYKKKLDNKNYVSKVKFEAEFKIYRNLSKAFNNMINNLVAVYVKDTDLPGSRMDKIDYYEEAFIEYGKSCRLAGNTLWENAAFISKDLYEKYNSILVDCYNQEKIIHQLYGMEMPKIEKLEDKDYEYNLIIEKKMMQLNDIVRDYLASLEIMD